MLMLLLGLMLILFITLKFKTILKLGGLLILQSIVNLLQLGFSTGVVFILIVCIIKVLNRT
jgi:hypothetical protein